jgi:adenylate cyclase
VRRPVRPGDSMVERPQAHGLPVSSEKSAGFVSRLKSAASLLPNTHYGTERYPEKIARRLRATNIAAWIGAGTVGFFAVSRFFQGFGHWKYAALVSLALGLAPVLHRLGPLAAPLALTAVVYTWSFWLSINGGVTSGTTFFYFTAGALAILLVGAERVFLCVLLGGVAVALLLVAHLGVSLRGPPLIPATPLTFAVNALSSSAILFVVVIYAVRQFTRAEERAEREHQRSEGLLLNILPRSIAERLKERPDVAIADAFPSASILFADMAGFTARASNMTPQDLVRFLNSVYTQIDSLVERHGLEKIKTTGDAYMVVSGVPEFQPDHAVRIAHLALEIRDALTMQVDPKGQAAPMRIGIASGPVVAGVIGTRKFFFDVWGDAVNTASRMESTGEAGKIQVAQETYELLADGFVLEERGVIDVRGKGQMRTWFLIERRPQRSRGTAL